MASVAPKTTTLRYHEISQENIRPNEIIVTSSDSTEERGRMKLWRELAEKNKKNVIWIKQINREIIEVRQGTNQFNVNLRNYNEVETLLQGGEYLLDISGLSHCVLAPIIKSLFDRRIMTRVLYAEPRSYKSHPSPASANVFDLSITVEGVAPLPGFACLSEPLDESKCLFVAMLGFEGNRPERLLLDLEPTPKVIPIIGVPGFRMEYPAFTVGCNRTFLTSYNCSSELRFARASCPYEAFQELVDIKKNYPDYYLYLALVGTKPHALGAIIYALANPESAEILFDHPVRKKGRTDGVELVHIYEFRDFNEFRV